MYAYCNNHPVGTADYDGHVAVGASIALDLLLKLLIELVISAGCTCMIYEAVDSISGKQEQVPSYDEFKNQSKQDKKSKHKEKAKEDSGEKTETGVEGESSGKGSNSSNRMIGENGTQTSSKTTWKNGETERIDVENPKPGERPGQIHYHDSNNKKFYYDIKEKIFYDDKTDELAPNYVNKLLNDKDFVYGIEKGLKILGEK